LTFAGCTLKNKGMAFYLCGKFGKEVVWQLRNCPPTAPNPPKGCHN
jgi:hypothetical protein